MINEFLTHLRNKNLSESSIEAYVYSVRLYKKFSENNFTKQKLLEFKGYLLENFKPQTVNLRIQAINKYLEFIGKAELRLSQVKIQRKTFLENVISNADYTYLKASLKRDKSWVNYFMIRYLAATGARVCEFVEIKAEHVFVGYFDIYSKGGKIRRLYIPATLKEETEEWLKERGVTSGYLFSGSNGGKMSCRTVEWKLTCIGEKYGIDSKVMHPHSFRHLFAKNFLEKHNDISLLADLMGHESIETTRIYLRKTAGEQREIVDRVITW